MTPLIDTHAHLTFPEFDADRASVLSRAWEAGLEAIVCVGAGAGLLGNIKAIEFTRTDERLFAIVGIHPHDADAMDDGWSNRIEEMAGDEKVVGIGEIGLDYHHMHSSKEAQRARFRELLPLRQGGKAGRHPRPRCARGRLEDHRGGGCPEGGRDLSLLFR